MSLGTIQINGQRLSSIEMDDICKALQSSTVRCLSLRKCSTSDALFQKLMTSVGCCKSILQLNVNLGLIKNYDRVKNLCHAIYENRSLNSLFLHGSSLHDTGMQILCKVLTIHPNISSLDIGDCEITDTSLPFLAELLPPNGAKRGLQELTLSGNNAITSNGWVKFFISVASSNTLRKLYLDYTILGEQGVNCLAVSLAASRTLEILDLESSGITENGAQTLLHLLKNYPVTLTEIVLSENPIKNATKEAIKLCLQENEEQRRLNTYDSNFIAAAMENSSIDGTSSAGLESTMGSTISINTSTTESELQTNASDSETDNSYDLLDSVNGSVNNIKIEDDDSAESDTSTVIINKNYISKKVRSTKQKTGKQIKKLKEPQARKLPQIQSTILNRNEAETEIVKPRNKGKETELISDSDEEDMGTLLIGETLPGHYAYPVRIFGNYNSHPVAIASNSLHAQNTAQMLYSD